jgi:Thioredoxin-like proteins and domains
MSDNNFTEITATDIEDQIKEILAFLRPYLQRDGGDVEYVGFKDGIVTVRFLGACVGCAISDITLYDGIERALIEEVPGVIGVEAIE